MGKAMINSVGVVITDSDFNIKYVNSSASEYIRENNLKTSFEEHPVWSKFSAKENFVDERIRIYRKNKYYDLYCSAEYGENFTFVFNGIQVSDMNYSFCRDELGDLVGELKCFVSMIDTSVGIMMKDPEKRDTRTLNNIKANVTELSKAMTNCIGLAKAEDGTLIPKKELLDLVMLVKILVHGILAYFCDDRIHINFRGREELVLLADFDMLRRAIVNILSTSLYYAVGACEIDIDVSVSHSNAVLRIINHFGGKYIEMVRDIFNLTATYCRDKKPQPDTRRLAVEFAEKCIELNGGTISFDTICDGACFIIEIPIKKDAGTLCSEAVHPDLNYDSELFDIREKRNGEKDA